CPAARAPHLASAELVKQMRPGSVLVDISIDQGGCFETSHVTTHADPTYLVDDVVHYAVGNMPGAVPRTSTYALTNVTLPYVLEIASAGVETTVRGDPSLARGVNTWDEVVVAAELGRDRARQALIAMPQVTDPAGSEFTYETFDHYEEHTAEIVAFGSDGGG